jgi:hypothetical protein
MLLLQYTNADLIDILSNFKSPETQRCVKLSPRYVLSWIYLDRLEPVRTPASATTVAGSTLDRPISMGHQSYGLDCIKVLELQIFIKFRVDASITTNQLSNLSKLEETVGNFF